MGLLSVPDRFLQPSLIHPVRGPVSCARRAFYRVNYWSGPVRAIRGIRVDLACYFASSGACGGIGVLEAGEESCFGTPVGALAWPGSSCASAASAVLTPLASFVTASSVRLFITMILMRRLTGSWGAAWPNGTDDAKPTTRNIFDSPMPPAINARREALARSADSSQLL